MKQLIFFLLLVICSLQAFAQHELLHPKERQQQMMVSQPQPYIEVGGKQVAKAGLVLIPARHIERADVLKGDNATATDKFGDKAKDGAIILAVEPTAKLVTIQDIYTQFGIPANQQNLQVVINKQLVKDTSLILAKLDQIKKAEVVKQDITAPVRWSLNDEEEFLQITSKPYPQL